jgi:hypothetical protein
MREERYASHNRHDKQTDHAQHGWREEPPQLRKLRHLVSSKTCPLVQCAIHSEVYILHKNETLVAAMLLRF